MQIEKIERALFMVPEIEVNKYKAVDELTFCLLENEFRNDPSVLWIFPFCRGKDDDKYIDIYIFDIRAPDTPFRIILKNGYRPSEHDACIYFEYLKELFDDYEFVDSIPYIEKFMLHVNKEFPEWHIPFYFHSEFRLLFEHIYYASQKSGSPHEILFKADCSNIAHSLTEIPCNLIGRNPEDIIGLPMRLLRILNSNKLLISYLFTEESKQLARRIYTKFSGYISCVQISYCQWKYLEGLFLEDNERLFSRKVFEQLGGTDEIEDLFLYREYFELKNLLGVKISIPKLENVENTVDKLRIAEAYIDKEETFRNVAKDFSYMEYTGLKYQICLPRTIKDLLKESISQQNCLLDSASYIEKHINEQSLIAFIKEKYQKKSFVTLEIQRDGTIIQARGKQNALPSVEAFIFLEEVTAIVEQLKYNPQKLILDTDDIDYEMSQYLKRYKRRRDSSVFPECEECGMIQLSLDDFLYVF